MKTNQYTVHIDRRGRMVLPVGIRRQLGIEHGSALIMAMGEDGMLQLIAPGEAARRGRGLLRELSPDTTMDRHLVEELIAERRSDAEFDEMKK